MVRLYRAAKRAKSQTHQDPDLDFCYSILNLVSRSFAVVIQQLPQQLKDAICIFYLVLRALDTIEDDMSISAEKKVPELLQFHKNARQRDWLYPCGEGHYKQLMAEYPRVTRAFLKLNPSFQQVISEIAQRMGAGMAEFIEREVVTVADYDLYCHYVAGLVGLGLTKLFKVSQLEDAELTDELSNHMGLFLQKTNIIRDYLEDINEEPAPRMFWPRQIWSQYAHSLEQFKQPDKSADAVRCLNNLILDVLRHAEHSLAYLAKLTHVEVFRFCAIPQVMAIGTLAVCFNNAEVFRRVVKMRRGQVALYTTSLGTMSDTYLAFAHFTCMLLAKCKGGARADAHAAEIQARLHTILARCAEGLGTTPQELEAAGSRLGGASASGVLSLHILSLLALVVAVSLLLYATLAGAWRS